jgi:brefeldin A-inhibited guanine nucleotide-exchange protein
MIIGDFNQLKPDVQGRNIAAWSPVVAEVLQGFGVFDDHIVSHYLCPYYCCLYHIHQFHMYLPALYPLAVELLVKDISPEIRTSLRSVLLRISPGS